MALCEAKCTVDTTRSHKNFYAGYRTALCHADIQRLFLHLLSQNTLVLLLSPLRPLSLSLSPIAEDETLVGEPHLPPPPPPPPRPPPISPPDLGFGEDKALLHCRSLRFRT